MRLREGVCADCHGCDGGDEGAEELAVDAGSIRIKDFVVRAVPGIDMRLLFDVLRAVKAAA